MNITITDEAKVKLAEKINEHLGYIKLKYDTEGCGCVVSGVAALWLVAELESEDVKVETNGAPIYIEESKKVFFDEQMTISFSETANCFQLKSPSQYLNPRMSFYNKLK